MTERDLRIRRFPLAPFVRFSPVRLAPFADEAAPV